MTNIQFSNANIELQIIEELMHLTVTAVNFEELAQRIVERCADLLDAELCTLWRLIKEDDQDKLVLAASKGFQRKPGEDIPTYTLNWQAEKDEEIEGITAWIVIRREPYLVNSHSELRMHSSWKGKWDKMQWEGQAATRFKSLIGIPLLVQEDVVGVMKAENHYGDGKFKEEHLKLAQTIAPFIAIALRSMNFRENQERQRQEAIKRLTLALLKPFEPQQLYQQIVNEAAELLNAQICAMWLCSDDRKTLKLAAAHGVKSQENAPSYSLPWNPTSDEEIEGVTAWVAVRRKKADFSSFEDLKEHPSWRGRWDGVQWEDKPEKLFGALYAVPLISNDRVLGVLKIENLSERGFAFSDVDKATFDVMTDFIALALELNSRINALKLLSETGTSVAELIDDVDTLLNQIARLAAQALNWQAITIWLFDENRTRLWLRAAYGPHRKYIGQHYYVSGDGLTWHVAETGNPIRVRVPHNLKVWKGKYDEIIDNARPGSTPLIALPLESRGQIISVMKIGRWFENVPEDGYEEFTEIDEMIAKILARQIAIAINKAKFFQMRMRAVHSIKNSATSLRAYLYAYMQKAERGELNTAGDLELLKKAEGQLERIEQLATNALRLLRPIHLRIQQIDLVEFIQTAISDIMGSNNSVTVSYELDNSITCVPVDVESMKEVFEELTSNAISAMNEKGNILVRVQLAQQEELNRYFSTLSDKYVVIEFIDNGSGVPNEFTENLFEPFVSSTPVNTGLGLAIVRSIINKHGGQIWLDKEYKNGAKFVITLPLTVERSVNDATETQTAFSR